MVINCKIKGCKQKHFGLEYCGEHYRRLKRYGDPLYVPTAEEISKKISKANKGNIPHNKGKKGVSKETSEKLSKANKGKKRTQKTRDNISKGKTKSKKFCKFCDKLMVNLEKHYDKCFKNPDNTEKIRIERNQNRKENKVKINLLQNAANAKRMQNPEKKKRRQKKQHDNNQIPEVRSRNNQNRKITRPVNDRERSLCLFFILGGFKCVKCGFHDHRGLERDHINDDGNLDNQRFSDDRSRDLHYIHHPEEAREKLQVLCSNCNGIKLNNKREIDWNLKNHQPRSVRDRINYKKLTQEAHQILGEDICVKCDFKDKRAIDIEHIHGGGNKDRKQFSRRNLFLENIIKNPEKSREKLQLMCRNCNTIKLHIKINGNCNCKKFHVKYFNNE